MFKQFGKILKSRILVTCFATAVVFFSMTAVAVPTSSALAPPSIIQTYYYTDNTYTVQCGYYCRNCQGQVISNGCVTYYKVTYTEPCGM